MKFCAEVALDLPWYVNGTLDEPARAEIEAHLAGCVPCRGLLRDEQRLAGGFRSGELRVVPLPQGAWRVFEERLDRSLAHETPCTEPAGAGAARHAAAPAAAAHSPARRRMPRGRARRRALSLAIAAQAVALVLLAGVLWVMVPAVRPAYRTVTDPEPALAPGQPLVRVVVARGVTAARLHDLAREAGAAVVAGPREGNIFTLAVPPASRGAATGAPDAVVAALRGHPEVLLAERVSEDASDAGAPGPGP